MNTNEIKKGKICGCEISWRIISGQLEHDVDCDYCDETESHDYTVMEALVDFLMRGDYALDRDDRRGFANEYTMILRECSERQEISREDAESWADGYLYGGDDATKAYVGFKETTMRQ